MKPRNTEQDDTPTTPRETTTARTSPEKLLKGWWKNHKGGGTPKGNQTPPLIIIYWWDAITYANNWGDHTDHPTPCPTITVGWVTHHDEHGITIVPLVNPHNWGNGLTIPTGCIHHITPIGHTP